MIEKGLEVASGALSVLDLDPSANYIGFRYAKIQQSRHLIFLLSTIF